MPCAERSLRTLSIARVASIQLMRNIFGHSLAFFEKYWLVRFAADGGMRKADAMIRQPI
jgi:hypothetical protein